MTQAEIGQWLALRREAAGLTQMEAAVRAGKDSGHISKWERGVARMSAESFLALVVLYGAQRELVTLLTHSNGQVKQYPPLPASAIQRVAEGRPSGQKKKRSGS